MLNNSDLNSGLLGGIALVYVGQPLDTVKVKMQTFPSFYKNMFQCFVKTLKNDGIYRGLYAGTVPALIANVAENSVLFFCYGFCQKFMQKITSTDKVEDLSTVQNATAGCLASFFSSLAICPTELVKCKLQAMHEHRNVFDKKINGPMQLTAQIIKTEGFQGLFRGFLPLLAREMPGYFFFFGGYEGTRELLRHDNQSKDDIGLFKTMTAGAVGGMVFWTLTYPVDVVKSRIQVYNLKGNFIKMCFKILRVEGVSALYHGLGPTVVRTVPATATLFVTYEYSKRFLHDAFRDF